MSEPIQVGGGWNFCERCGEDYHNSIAHECPTVKTFAPPSPPAALETLVEELVRSAYADGAHQPGQGDTYADRAPAARTALLARLAAVEQERDTSRAEHKADLRVMADLEDDRNALRGQLDKAEARVAEERERALRWAVEEPRYEYANGERVRADGGPKETVDEYVARGLLALEKEEI